MIALCENASLIEDLDLERLAIKVCTEKWHTTLIDCHILSACILMEKDMLTATRIVYQLTCITLTDVFIASNF